MSKIKFFILFIYFINCTNIIRIPFSIKENIENENKSFMESIMKCDIYTEITIGNPSKKIKTLIKFNDFNLQLLGSNISNHIYDETKSSSYKKIENSKIFYNEDFEKGEKGIENIKIGNINLKEFPFILITEGKLNEISSIGLKPNYNYKDNPKANLIEELISQNKIEKKIFSIIFNKKEKNKEQTGEIIIGNYLHEINKEQYKPSYYVFTKLIDNKISRYWDFKVDQIKIGLNNLFGTKNINLDIESEVFYGSISYFYDINETFFESYIDYKECWFEVANDKYNNKYDYYVCNKTFFNPSNFPNLTFVSNDLNISFVFTYQDLFIEKNNLYYFIILFNQDRDKVYNWVLGKKFIEKYHFVFDQEKLTVGYYTQVFPKKFNWKYFYIGIAIFVIFILGIILGYQLIKKPRKIKANELLDVYDFIEQKNI